MQPVSLDRQLRPPEGIRQATWLLKFQRKRYILRVRVEVVMIVPAKRMKTMRELRRAKGLRELRLIVPDARSAATRQRISDQVANLNPRNERKTLAWIETVSEFDGDAPR